jgi:hypothetical protein
VKTAEILPKDGCQLVKLPDEFQFEGSAVSVRRQGRSLILEPIKSSPWPPGFFDRIRIDDPACARPPQGELHPIEDRIDRCNAKSTRHQHLHCATEPATRAPAHLDCFLSPPPSITISETP